MKTIYKTIGAAKEYCDYAVDIYENCPHKCSYCYAKAKVENKNNEFIFKGIRNGVLEATKEYLENHIELKGKTIFLGFSSDAFATNEDVSATVEMAKLLKNYGCRVMICTKGKLTDTFKEAIKYIDSVGISISCSEDFAKKYETNAASVEERKKLLKYAKECGKETWISFEPVLEEKAIYDILNSDFMKYVDIAKFGKLNHMNISDLTGEEKDNIDWKKYTENIIKICNDKNINYIIKKALKDFLN